MEKRIHRRARIYSSTGISAHGMKVVTDRLVAFYAGLNMHVLADNNEPPCGSKHGLQVVTIDMEMDNPANISPDTLVARCSHSEFIKRAPSLFYYFGSEAAVYSKSSATILGPLHVRTEPLENDPQWIEQEVRDETGWTEPVYLAGPETTIIE